MVQAKAKEQTERKVTHKRTPKPTELPTGVVKNDGAPSDIATAEQEARIKRIKAVHGQFAYIDYSSEDYDRDKQREIKREDKTLE